MEKKSVAATILVIFLALVFSVIGICFSTFVYKDTRIIIEKVSLAGSEKVQIYEDKELKKQAKELKLSDMELGLKPATGELDSETEIPSTIDNQGTSEGYYATVHVKASSSFKIVVKNVVIETKKDQIAADTQKKNIFISIMGYKNTTKSLENDETELAKFTNVNEPIELTFLLWLGSLATDDLEGAKINLTLDFVQI